MINQTNLFSSNKNAFAPFKKNDAPNYAITTPFGPMNELKEFKKFNKERSEKRSKALGISIATTAIVTPLIVLLAIKGPARVSKRIDKLIKNLNEKAVTAKHAPNTQSFYIASMQILTPILEKSKALFNIMPLKDILVKRAAEKVPGVRVISEKISQLFEKIAIRSLNKSYNKTSRKFTEMTDVLKAANERLLSDNPNRLVTIGEETLPVYLWIKRLETKIGSVNSNYSNNFGSKAVKTRIGEMRDLFRDFGNKVWDRTYGNLAKFFKSKDTYQTFISEELAAEGKTNIYNNVMPLRTGITNDVIDKFKSAKTTLSHIDMLINSKDEDSCKIVGQIRRALSDYKKSGGTNEKEINDELGKLRSNIRASKQYKIDVASDILANIDQFKSVINSKQTGEIEEILNIYNYLFGDDSVGFGAVKKSAHTAVKSLNKSIDLEIDKLYDKFRDINVGSPPTDALGVLMSIGAIALGLKKADNSDEKVSVSLKYGIPALGAILTALYCTVGLFSGGPAITIGLLSGYLMHKVGAFVDNKIKNYKENSAQLPNSTNISKSNS